MTDLGQVCLFSNLMSPFSFHDLCMLGLDLTCSVVWVWIGVVRTSLFFIGFKVVIYWQMIKILKECEYQKEGRSNIKGAVFYFFFYQSKLISYFVPVIPVSPDTTPKKRCLG